MGECERQLLHGLDLPQSRFVTLRLEVYAENAKEIILLRRILKGGGHTWEATSDRFVIPADNLNSVVDALRYLSERLERDRSSEPDGRLEGSKPTALTFDEPYDYCLDRPVGQGDMNT